MSAGAASSTNQRCRKPARELFASYAFFLPPREMLLSYLQPGADDDHQAGAAAHELALVSSGAMRPRCAICAPTRRAGSTRRIPPPLIRPEVIAAFRADARALLPPQFIALIEATPAPFFQPIFDLESPRLVAGRVALLGDAAFVARPHVGAGVTKAALNAAWLTDALTASPISMRRSPPMTRRRAPSVRRWSRGRAISAPIWKTRRARGLTRSGDADAGDRRAAARYPGAGGHVAF